MTTCCFVCLYFCFTTCNIIRLEFHNILNRHTNINPYFHTWLFKLSARLSISITRQQGVVSYKKQLAAIVRQYYNTAWGVTCPLVQRLESLGELLCLAVGAFGEVSEDPVENHPSHCWVQGSLQGSLTLQGDLTACLLRQGQDGSLASTGGSLSDSSSGALLPVCWPGWGILREGAKECAAVGGGYPWPRRRGWGRSLLCWGRWSGS